MRLSEDKVLAEIRRLTRRDLRHWVRQGWVRPVIGETGPLFDTLDVARLRLLCDLRKDMAVPASTMPVVLSLLDQLHQTRRDLVRLLSILEDQPRDVRAAFERQLRARNPEQE
ncbi:MerR family transcriptional regulator [Pseudaestuariivita atlantica]|uniref:HTH merR-type domain-containing protein n=1 Tax=Pseudaestuariivita atlantica TaxID=1317121 RepID=A0A0L1JMY0_9RHOB|nr:MerR family transcriptional regulator [Pseudaestuariivita atlantica]KNG93111.1 hypothetical protein ATO11_14480 [Pseudaestuariivita atlantica]